MMLYLSMASGCNRNNPIHEVALEKTIVSGSTSFVDTEQVMKTGTPITLRPDETVEVIPTDKQLVEEVINTLETQQAIPTLTPLPTLPRDEALSFVITLIEKNYDCKFPCFWGIIPGETTWDTANQFLASFSIKIEKVFEEIKFRQGEEQKITYYVVETPLPVSPNNLRIGIEVKNDVVDLIFLDDERLRDYYPINQILNIYGSPNEVLLHIEPKTPIGKPTYQLVFLYKSGILFYYWGTAEFKQEEIEICLEAARLKLVLFQKDTYGIEQMKRLVDVDYVRSIRTIPDMDEKKFFEHISQPGFCFVSNRGYLEKP